MSPVAWIVIFLTLTYVIHVDRRLRALEYAEKTRELNSQNK